MAISVYLSPPEQPGTARQIVALGVAFAVVVIGLIAFNLTLERVSLLDDLKKDVQSLALVHRNYAEWELREYHGLLEVLADRVRHGDEIDDLIRQRRSYDPTLVDVRILGPCVIAPGTGCPSAAAPPSGSMPGLLIDAVPDSISAKKIRIARQLDTALDPASDPAFDPTSAGFRHQASVRMIALTLDLDRMAQGLQGVAGTLDATVKLALDHTANDNAATGSSFGDGHVAPPCASPAYR